MKNKAMKPGEHVIRATCSKCKRDVEMLNSDIVVLVRVPEQTATYAFQCPLCKYRVVKPADYRLVDLLIESKVQVKKWERPKELDEKHDGPPLTHDDVLAFHLFVESLD